MIYELVIYPEQLYGISVKFDIDLNKSLGKTNIVGEIFHSSVTIWSDTSMSPFVVGEGVKYSATM